MPKGYPNPKQSADVEGLANAVSGMASAAFQGVGPASSEPETQKLARVKLDRNYRPHNPFEVVGHHQPEIKRKDSAGRDVTIQEAAFIEGAPMPSAIAGTGFRDKVWAGTVIELPETEARAIVKQKIGSLEFAD